MAVFRTLAGVVALVLVVGPGSPITSTVAVRAATALPFVLDIRLQTTQALAAASAGALMAEASSIWRDGLVTLQWGAPQPIAGAEPFLEPATPGMGSLRVVVMARLVPAAGESRPWAVGELVRTRDAEPLAIASITGARRVVDEANRFQLLDEPHAREHRIGVVLGRAVAHEIGHYLLATDTHASAGLMRATIDAREFANLDSRTFRLDADAQTHLQRRRRDATTRYFSYEEK